MSSGQQLTCIIIRRFPLCLLFTLVRAPTRGASTQDHMAAAATSSEHQAAAIDEQWHELQRSDRWTVNAAVAAAARANPSTQRHDRRALRWRPHEPHELEAMSAWADLQAAETSLAVAHTLKRGRRQVSQVPESSSPIHRKRNRWTAMVAATELAFGQQCVIST